MKRRKRRRSSPVIEPPGARSEQAGARRRNLLVVAGLVAITLLAYSNSLQGGFVFDSRGLILDDARVHAATRQNLALILRHTYWWPYGESGLYRPLTTLTYLFNYALLGNGARPAGYHALNLLLHLVNVLLAFSLARRVLGDLRAAAWVAALWAVHPILTEAVTNIVGRPDLLAGLAVLGGLLAYLQSAEARGGRRLAWLAVLGVITFVGVFSKESAIVLPGVIVLFEMTWWKERRHPRALLLGGLAMLPAILALLVRRAVVLGGLSPTAFPFWDNPLSGAGFWTAKLTALAILARYVGLLVWPLRLSCDYSYAQIPLAQGAPQDWLAWLLIAAVAAGFILAFRRNRAVFFATAMAFVTLLPSANLLFPIGTMMAERLLYLPALAFAVGVVVGLFALGRRLGRARLAPLALSLIVAALAIRTWVRNLDWRDDVHLMTAAADVVPGSFKAHAALATALYDSDPTRANIARVLEEAEKSVAILEALPDARRPPRAYCRAGHYFLAQGDLAQSRGADGKPAYRRALELLERCQAAALAGQEELAAQARARGRPIPELDSSRIADLERDRAAAHLGLGDAQKAGEAAERALEDDPRNAEAYRARAAALVAAGRLDDAAVTLAQGVMMTSDMSLREDLLRLYREGLDTEGCAVVRRGPYETAINPACGIVRKHSCAAVAASMRAYVRLGQRQLAEQIKASALRDLGCNSGPLEAVLP